VVAAVALTAVAPLWILASASGWSIVPRLPGASLNAFWPYLCALSILVLGLILARTPLRFPLLMPLVLIGTAEASFLSQGAQGSTYGLFPLLVLLQGFLVAAFLPPERPWSTWAAWAFAVVGAVCLTTVGYGYVARNDRLFYADVRGPVLHASTHPRLHGMRSSGEYIPDLDRLLAWVDANVPPAEPLMTIPGEDPVFYALRRPPRMPVLLLERSTLTPYTNLMLAEFVRERGIVWIVYKTKLQCCTAIAQDTGLISLLAPYFDLVKEIGPYRIYRRNARE
jgi:hypothetical protein